MKSGRAWKLQSINTISVFSLVALLCGVLGVAAWEAFSQAPPPPPPEGFAIVDDADGPQRFAFSAPSRVEEARGFRGRQLHGGYWRVRPDGTKESANHLQAAFPFLNVPAGEWEFFATWAPHNVALPSEAESRVLYAIRDGDAIHPSVQMVDQRREPEGMFAEGVTWQSIGKIQTQGGLVLVVLSPLPPVDENKVRGQILADAIMMRPAEHYLPQPVPVADLSVSVDPSSPVNAGGSMDVMVVARNDGPDAATDVIVSIDFPPGGPPTGLSPGSDCSGDGTEFFCRAPALEAGQSVAFSFSFPLPPYPSSSPVRTIARVRGTEQDPVLSNNRHAADAEVNPASLSPVDLSVDLMVPPSLEADAEGAAVVRVGNAGLSPATDVMVTIVFPPDVALYDFPTECYNDSTAPSSSSLSCAIPTLGVGANVSFPLTFIAPSNPHPAPLWIFAYARSAEPEEVPALQNNKSVGVTKVAALPPPSADLSVSLSAPALLPEVTSGEFAVAVRNGGSAPATNVVVTVDIPPRVSMTGLPPGCTSSDTEVTCGVPSLTEEQGTVQFSFRLLPLRGAPSVLRTIARVRGAEQDQFPENNRAMADTEVSPAGGGGGTGGVLKGNLFITLDTTPVRNHQLLGGETGESILRLRLRARGEDAVLSFLRFTSMDSTASSVEYLELYREGETERFAEATIGACEGYALDRWEGTTVTVQSFCARIEGTPLLMVGEGSSVVVIVRPRLKTDVGGATSNQIIRFGIAGLGSSVRALGRTSGLPLAANDGDGIAEGEIFLGTDIAQANRDIIDRAEHVVVLAKITSITNANPDAHGTHVPTGDSPIGRFKFTAAPNRNFLNGMNQVVLSNVIFRVDMANVTMDDRGFRLYNMADATQKAQCYRIGSAYGSPFGAQLGNWDWGGWFGGSEQSGAGGESGGVQRGGGVYDAPGGGSTGGSVGGPSAASSFLVECPRLDQSMVNTSIDVSSSLTFALQGNITNAKVAPQPSLLQVSLTNFTSGDFDHHIQWIDRDITSVSFDWIEYPETTVKSTRYEM